MSYSIDAATLQAVSSALDAALLRQQVIAANIAHANTPGYVAQRVSFASLLEGQATEVTGPVGVFEPALDARGQPMSVHLDQEVAAMAQNALHYQALLKGVSRHLSLLAAAVNDGKR
jgi:flagellar basal-body rod protein FlgB